LGLLYFLKNRIGSSEDNRRMKKDTEPLPENNDSDESDELEVYRVGDPDPEAQRPDSVFPVEPGATPPPLRPGEEPFQFSVRELFFLVLLVATMMAVLSPLPLRYAAGLAGIGVLVSLLVITVVQPSRPIVLVAWWVLFFVYLMICAMAIFSTVADSPAALALTACQGHNGSVQKTWDHFDA
jgi:hypothetical protein